MHPLKVVDTIILHDNQIFATQRGYGDFKGGWEFPGGKVESGESPQEALRREIREELAMEIEVGELFEDVAWLPADLGLIEQLKGKFYEV